MVISGLSHLLQCGKYYTEYMPIFVIGTPSKPEVGLIYYLVDAFITNGRCA